MSSFNRDEFEQSYFKADYLDRHAWLNTPNTNDQLYMFTKPFIGEDDEMGKQAFIDLLLTISENHPLPKSLVFWNRAVMACTENNEALDVLIKLEQQGINILVSDSSLMKLDLKRELRAGKTITYFELLEVINKTKKIINF